MEIRSRPARRYAQAFLDWVQTEGVLAEAREDVERLRLMLEGSVELRYFMGNYLIPQTLRQATLKDLFEQRRHPALLRLIYFLEFKKRTGLLSEILSSFQEKDEFLQRIVRGRVVYAWPPVPEIEQQVKGWVAARCSATEFRIDHRMDAALIGGLTIQVGDLFWDGSVVGNLRRLRRQLENSRPDRG